jgi:hypothetical protein
MPCFNNWDIGVCGCGPPACTQDICNAGQSNLWCGYCWDSHTTDTWSVTIAGGSLAGTYTLSWNAYSSGFDGWLNIIQSGIYWLGFAVLNETLALPAHFFVVDASGTISQANVIAQLTASGSGTRPQQCNPMAGTKNVNSLINTTLYTTFGVTSYTFQGPAATDYSCCNPPFTVTGCGGSIPVGGTINIWNSSSKTTLYGTATISGNPTIVAVSTLSATFYYEVSATGYATASGTQSTEPNNPITVSLTTASGWCCQTFYTNECNSLPLTTTTISVYDHAGGTLLASGPFELTIQWNGSCSVYVTVTEPTGRFNSGQSLSLTNNSTTYISTLASGYTCFSDSGDLIAQQHCQYPLSNTLHCTFPAIGYPVTFTYIAGYWTSTFTWNGDVYVLNLPPEGNTYDSGSGYYCMPACTKNGVPFAAGTPAFTMDPSTLSSFTNTFPPGLTNTCPVAGSHSGMFIGGIGNSYTPGDPGYELDPNGYVAIITE